MARYGQNLSFIVFIRDPVIKKKKKEMGEFSKFGGGGGSSEFGKFQPFFFLMTASLSLHVGLLFCWSKTDIGISPVLDKRSFWNFSYTFQGCWYTSFKYFGISCLSVSQLIGLLPHWNYTNREISPVLDEQSFWNFLKIFCGCLHISSTYFQIFCMSVRLFIVSLPF